MESAADILLHEFGGLFMIYDKRIRYLICLEKGERVRTVGFVKMKRMDGLCDMQIQVNGLYKADSRPREIRISAGDRETRLGEIYFLEGRGSFLQKGMDAQKLGREGISYEELTEISIPLDKDRELRCVWKEQEKADSAASPEADVSESEAVILPEPVPTASATASVPVPEAISEPAVVTETALRLEAASEAMPADTPEAVTAIPTTVSASAPEPAAPVRKGLREAVGRAAAGAASQSLAGEAAARPAFCEDKWQQLSGIYPHIRPFQDERDYLSIGPADFVVLQKQYHRLVANSFLLHGYYNYDHLILTRVSRAGQQQYYLGVPGNFYEKERQVALMFGFESFECKEEPVRTGDFGYYCIRVDI